MDPRHLDDADLDEAVATLANADALIERDSLTDKTIFVVRDGVPPLDVSANNLSGSLLGMGIRAPPAPFALA